MPPLTSLTPRQLTNKLEIVEKAIEDANPGLWQERKLILDELERKNRVKGQAMAAYEFPKPAVLETLRLHDPQPMSHREIFEFMDREGYPWRGENPFNSLRDTLNHFVGRGRILKSSDRKYSLPHSKK